MNNSLLTSTRLHTLLTCPRKHFWRFEIGLQRLAKAAALRFGSAWHRAMEARWRKANYDDAMADAIPEGVDLDALTCTTIAALLARYYHYYANSEMVKECHPEVEFRQPLKWSRSFELAGKIDGLASLVDGRLALIEHKTCGEDISPGAIYWLRLRSNQQVLQYVLAARALGWNVEHVIYDVTRKPAIRQKQQESVEEFGQRLQADCQARPEFYFARREVPVLEHDLEEFKTERLVLARSILNYRAGEKRVLRREQAWPRNVDVRACGTCEYSSFCLHNITININQLPSGFELRSANPELKQTHDKHTN